MNSHLTYWRHCDSSLFLSMDLGACGLIGMHAKLSCALGSTSWLYPYIRFLAYVMNACSRFVRFVVASSVAIIIVFKNDNFAVLCLFSCLVDGLRRMWAVMRIREYVLTVSLHSFSCVCNERLQSLRKIRCDLICCYHDCVQTWQIGGTLTLLLYSSMTT